MRRSGLFVVMSMFAVTLFAGVGVCWAGWETQYSGVTEDLNDVFFIDKTHGWAIGLNSTVLATTDGGETWVKQELPVSDFRLERVQFINQNVGYIIGYSIIDHVVEGHLFHTNNGGQIWEIVETNIVFYYTKALCFIDENTGWIVTGGKDSRGDSFNGVLKTTDSGKTWKIQYNHMAMDAPYKYWGVYSVSFIDNLHGWVLYGPIDNLQMPRYLAYTENSGLEWQERGLVPFYVINNKIHPVSKDTLWIDSIGLNFTNDNGATWLFDTAGVSEFIGQGSSHLVGGVYPVGGSEAFIVTKTILFHTSDGGKTMTELVNYAAFGLWGANSISGVGGDTMWICGFDGMIARYIHEPSQAEEKEMLLPKDVILHGNAPNPFNPTTTISFTLPADSHTTLTVHDITGRKVAALADNFMSAGKHSAVFNGCDLASGVYFYRLEVGGTARTGKMLLVK